MAQTENERRSKNRGWGLYLALALIVAALCMGVLFYIGWFNGKTHVDSRNGDDVMEKYQVETGRPASAGENDWQEIDTKNVREVIVDHAPGTEANAPSATSAAQ